MKNMKQLKSLTVVAAMSLTLALAGLAQAHDLWLSANQPAEGKALSVLVGYGHGFPAGEEIEFDVLDPVEIIGAQGKIATKPGQKQEFVSDAPLAAGTYVVTGGRKAQWYTKTPAGSVNVPKNEAPEAISCLRSVKYAKAIVNLGAAGDVSQPVGQTLEIVPLANPGALKVGDDLPVRVLFEGKPLAKVEVLGLYAGFSQHEGSYAFYARTDKDGKAYVKLSAAGQWLVLAKHKVPFADKAQCDEYAHTATLTFDVK